MAKGESQILSPLASLDTEAMLKAIQSLGAKVEKQGMNLSITGTNGNLQPADDVIDCQNSGQVLRFIGALGGLLPSYTLLTGDASIRHRRPVFPLLKGLNDLGAFAASARGDGYAPILIKGPLTGSRATINGEDSQPVSGLLMAAAFAPHPIEIYVERPGEIPWIDLTLAWLKRFHLPCKNEEYKKYTLQGKGEIEGFTYTVPGDFSSAAYPIAAALITDSEITLHPVDMGDVQGDKALILLLQEMGAKLEIDPNAKTLKVKKGGTLIGKKIDVNRFIDALPILSVLGCFAEGVTTLYNGAIARKKESDRIYAMAKELKKMGALIEETSDGMIIYPSKLQGGRLEGHSDHRIVMSLAVAALQAKGETEIQGASAIEKSYPGFVDTVKGLGAKIYLR